MNWPDSPIGGRLGDGRFAHATDRPETVEALRDAVVSRVAHGYAIYPQGGATALDYGGTPRLPGIAIATAGLDRVVEYPAADMTITVESGIRLAQLRRVLAEEKQRLLVDAPHADRATLGGIYATNPTGPRAFGAGRPRDQVIGVRFVTSDGAEVKGGGRVVKNVAGYDFPKLLTGSLGTLGILTQLTLKVRPLPEAAAIVWIPYQGADAMSSALERLNTSGTRPVAIEVLNPSGARLAAAALGLPASDWALAVGFEDNAPSVSWQVDRLMIELGKTNVVIREGEDAAPLWSALIDFQAAEAGPVRFSFSASLRPSSVLPFLKELDPGLWAAASPAGSGRIHAHLLAALELERVAPEVERLRKLAGRDGGTLTLSRCPAEWKERLLVWGPPRPDWVLADRVKRALDPLGVMNPGRFVGTI